MRLHNPIHKKAAFLKAGVSKKEISITRPGNKTALRLKWLVDHEIAAKSTSEVVLPPLPTGGLSSPSAPPTAADFAARLADVSRADLEERGAVLVPNLLSADQAREVLLALGEKGALEQREEKMRELVGHGANGGYSTIKRS